ncbi:MAG: hypothetical protein GWP41_03495 [Planctomycetia bacterium]|nr:hypothetical protein [Planctomycetia bacterium]
MNPVHHSRLFELQVPWTWIPPEGEPKLILMGLHGMGQDGDYLGRKLQQLSQHGIGLILPSGPYPVEIRGKSGPRQGHAWYIYTGDQPDFRLSLDRSEEDLLRLVEAITLDSTIPDVPLHLLGFSQGGYLAGYIACRHPDIVQSCCIASARLKHGFLEKELTLGHLPKILFLHDKADRLTAAEPVVKSAEILTTAGAKPTIEWHDEKHAIGDHCVSILAQWLKEF